MEVPLLDQLVESEAMVIETSLLGVGHIEGGPWTAAKSMDNITLKHEAGVRRPFADLILVLFRPAPRCFDARLGYGPERFSDEPTSIRRSFLLLSSFFFQFSLHLPTFSAPASSTTHHATLPLSPLLTPDSLALLSRAVLPRLSSERSDPPAT
jgi:hypothetical protein